MMSDLYRTNAQQVQEIGDLMRDIDMPDEDESLTVSSMSQSPFHARSGPKSRIQHKEASLL
jgi:hypothetical protein